MSSCPFAVWPWRFRISLPDETSKGVFFGSKLRVSFPSSARSNHRGDRAGERNPGAMRHRDSAKCVERNRTQIDGEHVALTASGTGDGESAAAQRLRIAEARLPTRHRRFFMNSSSEESRASDVNAPLHVGNLRLRDIERAAIERTLAQTGNNQSQAARILGISRPTLLRKLKGYRVEDAAERMHRSADAAADFDERCCPRLADRG